MRYLFLLIFFIIETCIGYSQEEIINDYTLLLDTNILIDVKANDSLIFAIISIPQKDESGNIFYGVSENQCLIVYDGTNIKKYFLPENAFGSLNLYKNKFNNRTYPQNLHFAQNSEPEDETVILYKENPFQMFVIKNDYVKYFSVDFAIYPDFWNVKNDGEIRILSRNIFDDILSFNIYHVNFHLNEIVKDIIKISDFDRKITIRGYYLFDNKLYLIFKNGETKLSDKLYLFDLHGNLQGDCVLSNDIYPEEIISFKNRSDIFYEIKMKGDTIYIISGNGNLYVLSDLDLNFIKILYEGFSNEEICFKYLINDKYLILSTSKGIFVYDRNGYDLIDSFLINKSFYSEVIYLKDRLYIYSYYNLYGMPCKGKFKNCKIFKIWKK